MGELQRNGVSVAGVQETKWFGADVWPAIGGFAFLHSGKTLPVSTEKAVRKEGVGIMLDKKATTPWREAVEEWKAVTCTCSSRIVLVRLKWVRSSEGSEDVVV